MRNRPPSGDAHHPAPAIHPCQLSTTRQPAQACVSLLLAPVTDADYRCTPLWCFRSQETTEVASSLLSPPEWWIAT